MRLRTLLLVALLASTALPMAAAQAVQVKLSIAPSSGEVAPGGGVQATLTLRNDGLQPMTARIEVDAPEDVNVSLSQRSFTVLPGQSATALATLVANLSAAPDGVARAILFTANAASSTGGDEQVADTATYSLVVRPEPDKAPYVDTREIEILAHRNAPASYSVSVTNPTREPMDVDVTWAYPTGWEDRGAPRQLRLEPNQTHVAKFPLVALDRAVDGEGRLTLRNGNATVGIPLRLMSPPAAFSMAFVPQERDLEENGTVSFRVEIRATTNVALDLEFHPRPGMAGSVAPEALDLLAGQVGFAFVNLTTSERAGTQRPVEVNATERSTLEEHMASGLVRIVRDGEAAPEEPEVTMPVEPPAEEPDDNATSDQPAEPGLVPEDGENATASPEDDLTSRPESSEDEPVGEAPTLEVLPRLLEVPQGGHASANVLLRWPGADASEVFLEVALPPKFSGGLDSTTLWVLAPSREANTTLTLRADEDAPVGAEYSASVRLSDGSLSASFRVRVVPPVASQDIQADPEGVLVAPMDVRMGLALAAAGVGALALSFTYGRRRWGLAFAALYARIAPSRVLAHPVRERIMAEVRREPGVPLGVVQKRLALANGAMAHHAQMLERGGHLVSLTGGQLRRLFPAGVPRPAPVGDLASRALALLQQEGPLSASELARRLDVSRQALHYHLRKMLDDGRVQGRQEGRELVVASLVASAPGR